MSRLRSNMMISLDVAGPGRGESIPGADCGYSRLALVGAAFVTLGTLCSRDPWIAAGGMAAVGFVTLFSGAFGAYFAAGSAAAILTFVLPVTPSRPRTSAIPLAADGSWTASARPPLPASRRPSTPPSCSSGPSSTSTTSGASSSISQSTRPLPRTRPRDPASHEASKPSPRDARQPSYRSGGRMPAGSPARRST
jgi:hypothetical protein